MLYYQNEQVLINVTVILSRAKSEDIAVVEAYISHLNQIAGERPTCHVVSRYSSLY